MSVSDFESDPDYSLVGTVPPGFEATRDEEGDLFVNAEKAEGFDPRHTDDVEGMLFLGYLTHEFDFMGHKFMIRTLRRGERLACALLVKEYEDTLGLGDALQTAYVAASLVTVNGRPLTMPLSKDEHPIIAIRSKFDQVNKWYDYMVEAIYAKYASLLLRQKAAFTELESKSTASRLTP